MLKILFPSLSDPIPQAFFLNELHLFANAVLHLDSSLVAIFLFLELLIRSIFLFQG